MTLWTTPPRPVPPTPDGRTYAALLVRGGQIARIDVAPRGGDSGAAHTRELIGDTFSSAFQAAGAGAGRQLVAFADDTYLFKPGLAPNVWLDGTLYRGGWPILGPLVIEAFDGPDTVGMTELERSAFHLLPAVTAFFDGVAITAPVLTFRPGYDVTLL